MNSKFDSRLAAVFASAAIMLAGAGGMIAQSQMARANSPAVQMAQAATMPPPHKIAYAPVESNECVAVEGQAAPTYRCPNITVVARRTVKNVEVAAAR
jgi:hypothetical protein